MTMMIHDKEIEMDAKEEGTILAYVGMVRKKKNKGCSVNTTAEILELELAYVEKVYSLLEKYPDYTDQELTELIMSEK